MHSRLLYLLLPGLFAFMPANTENTPHNPAHPAFVLSHNQFAFHLLDAVLTEDHSGTNKLVSPLNLYLTLGMLCNGAAHDTRDSIAMALQATDMELPNLNSLCKETLQQLPLEDAQVQFNLANAIWYNRHKLSLLPEYEQLMENFYYAPIRPLDFGSHAAAAKINEWVAQNTEREIPAVIDRTQSTDEMILVNALYFKGAWQHPFDAGETFKGDFFPQDAAAREVAYMHKDFVARTYSDTSFTMVELPCGQGKDFSMYALLPQDPQQPVDKWIRTLDPARFNEALDKMTPQCLDLSLPRWECTYSVSNTDGVLNNLGMGSNFAAPGLADFSNMYKAGVHKAAITHFLLDTHIRVDEAGLVSNTYGAASSTAGANKQTPNPRVVRYDHPFAFFLLEKQRNLILMAGVVNDPAEKTTQPKPALVKRAHRLRSIFHHPQA
jgi:serpin B